MSADGVYVLNYSGQLGEGGGGLTVLQGIVNGAAHGPVRIGGTVQYQSDGWVSFHLVLAPTQDGTAVTGGAMEKGDRPDLNILLSPDQLAGAPFGMEVNGGPVVVTLHKVQDL